ncbi:hypothetical protein BH23ACT10_BH23ACT10_03000 [soil metagenome]
MSTSTTPTATDTTTDPTPETEATDRMANTVVVITGIRCVLMYMVLPAAGVIGSQFNGVPLPGAGTIAAQYSTPVLIVSLLLHTVTLVTTTIAVRRAFRSGHRWRWPYAMLGSTFFLFSVLSIFFEGALLLS